MVLVIVAALVAGMAPSLHWNASSDTPGSLRARPEAWAPGLQEVAEAAVAADAYAVQAVPAAETTIPAWRAPNPAQGLEARFSGDGVAIAPQAGTQGEWRWGFSTAAWGRAGQLIPASPAEPVAHGNRVEYRRAGLTEWYINDVRGLEQGFTVPKAPPGQGSAPLVVQLGLSQGLEAELIDQGQAVMVRSPEGAALVRYDKLEAYDANGVGVPAHLELDGSQLSLTVDDGGAAYPLVIDPLIASQQAELTAGDAAQGDVFGESVAVSGDTAVVGAPGAGIDRGSAYVFTRIGTTWEQQGKLTGADTAQGDAFGFSVAVSADTVVVGAPGAGMDSGSVYVFTRTGATWAQEAKLTAGDIAEGDGFGESVAVSDDTAVVGAPGAVVGSGAAYVFTRIGTTWEQQAKLTAGDAAQGDSFGFSVAVSADTAVVGAPGAEVDSGAAYVFTRIGTAWEQQAKLTGADTAQGDAFGFSVAVSSDTAVVGAPGDQDAGIDSGAAYVFTRSESRWYEQGKLTAADAAEGHVFGLSVAVSGDTAVVGAPGDQGAGYDAGSAYVFSPVNLIWVQHAKLTAADAAEGDVFGLSVAVSGDTAVVGAPGANMDSGSSYVFVPIVPNSRFVPVSPERLLDTRADGPQKGYSGLKPAAGSTVEVQVTGTGAANVPANAAAVVLNVTGVSATKDGFVTAWPCGTNRPLASNLNVTAGSIRPNLVISKVGSGGKVCLFTSGGTDLLADINGYFPAGANYSALAPERLLDTRADGPQKGYSGPKPAAGSTVEVQVRGAGTGVPADASAVVLNVTGVSATKDGFVTAWPCGSRPLASNLNLTAGSTRPNLVISRVGGNDRVCLFTSGGTDLVADINGYFPAGTDYWNVQPERLLDTRADGPQKGYSGPKPAAGSTVELQVTGTGTTNVPANASAVVLNITAVSATKDGFVTAWPCGTNRPLASNLNLTAGSIVPNLVVSKVGSNGKVCLFTSGGSHLVADINGYFLTEGPPPSGPALQ